MTKQLLSILVVVIFFVSCDQKQSISVPKAEAKTSIKAVMKMQEEAWSAGDIDKFMQGYWQSDSLTFIGRSGINYGWQTTLNNYKKGYPTKDAMGKLSFDIISLTQLRDDLYTMTGRYTLQRKDDMPTGYFTLMWQYIDGKWVIISDHTSG